MTTCIINHKKYTVDYRFNMVGNYYFTDKNGVEYLVDAEDITEWINSGDATPNAITAENGIDTAIAYARYHANNTDDGSFWWKAV